MRIATLLIANASAVMVGKGTTPHDETNVEANVEDVDMAVHIVERDGMETDEWVAIDAIAHGDDDDHEPHEPEEPQEGGWCNDI